MVLERSHNRHPRALRRRIYFQLTVFLVAGFSFQGTEGVGLAAAETTEPEKNVPKAIRTVFWRILLFYIGSIFVVGTLIAVHRSQSAAMPMRATSPSHPSPWCSSSCRRFGYYAANLMNAVILSSVLSCGNSSMYVASRMLHAMAHSRKAPRAIRLPQSARGARGRAAGDRLGERPGVFLHRGRRPEDLPDCSTTPRA